jgi:non-specific serine/threonine protein kinase
VIAMQFEITDGAAIAFAQWFYAAIASGYPVDAALTEARKAIYAQGHGVEWGTPVLYMRAPDGRIFDIEQVERVSEVEQVPGREEEPGPAPVAPLPPEDSAIHNLPVAVTSFVGREQEIAEIKRMLSSARLVTLSGPGGCGKTRLGLEVARDVLVNFADGVWLVDLAALGDAALVPQAVATVLGVREKPGRPLTETLTDYLRVRQLLLVLDNCERVVEACATLVDAWLRACPDLRVLATSREILRLSGEREFLVPPLALPDPHQPVRVDVISRCEAIDLFVQRAQAVKRNFTLDDANASVVIDICARLDGLPLAIELAAARIKLLSPQAILARLENRFTFLRSDARDLPARQQTLQATIDWSYDLLDTNEKVLFRRLAVFKGGRTLEAVETVCNPAKTSDGIAPLQIDVLDGLESLLDQSLLQQEAGLDEEPRFMMLVTIHEYAAERLEESGEAKTLRRRHAAYFLELAEEAEPALTGPDQVMWLNRLETEHNNLRAVLRWAIESQAAETGLRLAGALRQFWSVRGYYSEGRDWLARLLALAGPSERTTVRAKALLGAGALAYHQGDYASVRTFWEESLAIQRELQDRQGVANLLNNLGVVTQVQGDYAAACALFEESLAIFRELGDRRSIANSLNSLGIVARNQGDLTAARALFEENLAIFRELGDKRSIANSLNSLGIVARNQGDLTAARALFEESLAIRQELGDKQGVANLLNNLGLVAENQGDYMLARSLLRESLMTLRELGDRLNIAKLLESLASLATVQAQPQDALRLAGAAAALRESIGAPLSPADRIELERHLETARRASGEEASAQALADGRAMTLEQAIEYALGRTAQSDHAG